MSKQMFTLRPLTHLSSGSIYKIARSAGTCPAFTSIKSYAKMSTSAPAINGNAPYNPRFVDVSVSCENLVNLLLIAKLRRLVSISQTQYSAAYTTAPNATTQTSPPSSNAQKT